MFPLFPRMLSEIANRCSIQLFRNLNLKFTLIHLRRCSDCTILFTDSLTTGRQQIIFTVVAMLQTAEMEHKLLLVLVHWTLSV